MGRGSDGDGDVRIVASRAVTLQQRDVRPRSFTAARRQVFLDTLAATCNVTLSARAAGVSTKTAYAWRGSDRPFAEAWAAALAMGYERLEEAAVAYALRRIAPADPDAAPGDAVAASATGGLEKNAPSAADLQFALAVLNRRGAARSRTKAPSAAQTHAIIQAKLDVLVRKLGSAA